MARTAPLFACLPLFGSRVAGVVIGALWGTFVGIALAPALFADVSLDTPPQTLLYVNEVLIGVAMGLALRVLLHVGALLGHLLSTLEPAAVLVLAHAQRYELVNHSTFPRLFYWLVVALFILLDGPLLLVEGVIESYRWLPWSSALRETSLTLYLDGVILRVAHLLNVSLILALPLLVTGGLVSVLLALFERARHVAPDAYLRPWTLVPFMTTLMLSLAVVLTARRWLRVLLEALFDTLALVFA